MILWTVLPVELVLAGEEKVAEYEEMEYAGVAVQVEKLSPLECRIVRILSTDPADFLRDDIQPGLVLTYKPSREAIMFPQPFRSA